MGVQYRGCSHLYYAVVTEASDGTLTFASPVQLAPVKSVSRDISSDSEKIFADNVLQDVMYGANAATRTFETIKIAEAVQAALLGDSAVTIGSGTSAQTLYAAAPDGSAKPKVAVGYALHDGNTDRPCLLCWTFLNKCNSISLSSNTIDDGTGSEGQSVEFEGFNPKKAWTTTGSRNADIHIALDTSVDNSTLVGKWFAQVVTPDNAATVLA